MSRSRNPGCGKKDGLEKEKTHRAQEKVLNFSFLFF